MNKANGEQYRRSLGLMLSDRDLRILFWRFIQEDCKVFQEEFPVSAQAYCLLAVQQVGKRLLADAKSVSPELTAQAEADYNAFMGGAKTSGTEGDSNGN